MTPSARQRMIDTAADLFHRQGVKGTSVDEVLAKSGTGKGQFSHYFRTKDGLVHAVLLHLHQAIQSGRTPTGYCLRTWEDLDGWFGRYVAFQRSVNLERSCPIGTIGNDVDDQQPLLRQDVRLFFEWARGMLARFFAERRAAGELSAESDPDALADLCLAVMQGGMLITKITRSTRTFENAARQAVAFVRAASVAPGTRRRTRRVQTAGRRRSRPG